MDDELLQELGLEPKAPAKPPKGPPLGAQPKAPPRPPAVSAQPQPRPSAPVASKQAPESARSTGESFAKDMPVHVVAVLGKKTMTLAEVIAIKQGEVIDFKKLPQESIDLVANGKLVAKGELVLIDGKLGIQIKQLMG